MRRKRTPKVDLVALREYFAAYGRLGGLKGGPARAAKMTKEERSKSARKAARARWAKQKRTRPNVGGSVSRNR